MVSRTNKPKPPDDYDPAAPLTDEEIKRLRPARELFARKGIPMPRPVGRPRQEKTKVRVTMRIDPDVLEHFKAQGPGWQTRMGKILEEAANKSR